MGSQDLVDDELGRLGAVLLEERVLRRVIKQHRGLRGVGLQVPHERCYVLPRRDLAPLVEHDGVTADLASLPERVIAISGDRAALAAGEPAALCAAWRAVFHASVHQAFDELLATRALTLAAIRERINRVGQTEFDEIRSVLRQEELLLPPIDDIATYVEFVALYLELRAFAPHTIARTFPAVFDVAQVDATIALDLDPDALLAAARPERAPAAPVVAAPEPPPEPPEPRLDFADPSARKAAQAARAKGNRSRAAILAARAGDVTAARADLDALVARLARALGGPDTAGWAAALLPVAQEAAAQRLLRFSGGARLLHDLQAACVVAERQVEVADFVTWALSRGQRPLVRQLPAAREVRVAHQIRSAGKRLAASGVVEPGARDRLADALRAMARAADDHVRAVFRPKIEQALAAVGLNPYSLPERVAEKKLVDELLDRAVTIGRLSLPHLRDAISQNDLKLPDFSLRQLREGDQLLRADRILSVSLDGVYRRGEIYLRFLQQVSSVLFGTRLGRFLTLYLMLPLLGSFATVEGLQHMIGPASKWAFGVEPQVATTESLLGGAAFLFLLMHVALFRRAMLALVRGVWRGVRLVLVDAPLALWRLPLVRRVVDSRLVRWVVRPALPAALVVALVPGWVRWPIAGGVFVLVALLLNLRFGRLLEEVVADGIVRGSRHVTSRILPGAIRLILDLFVRLVELFERGLYRVDEWLRFRPGQSRVVMFVKGVLGTFWFAITYVLRLYVNLFIEPTVNPIKHFPVVTVAAKIIIPFIPAMLEGIAGPASALMGKSLGNSFAAFSVLVIPGLAGFLVWELKENWKLYRATRARTLRPLAIGHHGESIVRFLRRGFHSGTIPKLFTKLRRAAWRGDERGVTRAKEGLHHVEEAIDKFVERQLVSMVNEVPAFRATDVALAHVEIGSNRIRIALACPSVADEPATIRFEQQSGWIVASVAAPGWIDRLDDEQRTIFEIALAGFYKLSGVEIVREQVEQVLAGDGRAAPPYDISDEGMLVWPGGSYDTEIVYDLHASHLGSRVRGATYDGPIIDLQGRHALFGRVPLYWSVWSTTWQQIARGEPPRTVVTGPSLLRARG